MCVWFLFITLYASQFVGNDCHLFICGYNCVTRMLIDTIAEWSTLLRLRTDSDGLWVVGSIASTTGKKMLFCIFLSGGVPARYWYRVGVVLVFLFCK